MSACIMESCYRVVPGYVQLSVSSRDQNAARVRAALSGTEGK